MCAFQVRPVRLARMVTLLAVAASAIGSLALVGVTAPAAQVATVKIDIKGFAYSNPASKISVGEKVTWINRDDVPHDAAAKTGPVLFKSPILKKGESWAFTFTKAGSYS